MRLLTAGSLVRVQQGEPKRAGRHRSSCSFFLYLLTQTVPLSHTAAPAVNWLGAPRCLRQMKRCSEQEETTSVATRSKRARRLCFWPTGSLISIHLRCMKNEVASLMKCGQTAWKSKRALLRASIASTSLQRSCRFVFAEQTLHLLKSHCIKWILFNWQSSKTRIFLLCFTLSTDPNQLPRHTQPHGC